MKERENGELLKSDCEYNQYLSSKWSGGGGGKGLQIPVTKPKSAPPCPLSRSPSRCRGRGGGGNGHSKCPDCGMRGITDMDGHKTTLKYRKMVWSGGKSSWMSDCCYNYHLRQYEDITKTKRWSMMPHLSAKVPAAVGGNQFVRNITSENSQENLLVVSSTESKLGNAHVGRAKAIEKEFFQRMRSQPSNKSCQATTSFSVNNNLWNGPKIVSTTSLKPGEFHNQSQRKATSKGIKLGNVANNSVRKASPAAAPLKLPVEPVPKSMLEAGKYNGFPSWDEVNSNPPKRYLSGMMSEAVLLTPHSSQPQISLRNMDKIEAYRTEIPGSNLTFSWQIRDNSVKDADAIAADGRLRQHEAGLLLSKPVDPSPGGCADEVVLGF